MKVLLSAVVAGDNLKSANFGFLKHLDPSLVALGAQAEMLFTVNTASCIVKLRLLGERLAKELAAHAGIHVSDRDTQADLLHLLKSRHLLHPDVARIFHGLRNAGNAAVHEDRGTAGEALHQLKMCRRLGVAVLRTLAKLPPGFKQGAFVPPAAPKDASGALREELEVLRNEADKAEEDRAAALERLEFEQELREDFERKVAELKQQLQENEAAFDELAAARDDEIEAVQTQFAAQPPPAQQANVDAMVESAGQAGRNLDFTEAETRELIDRQLQAAGWDTDSPSIRYSRGVRPQKGRNMAIAEWPTDNGPADYALFVGLKLVGIVEAKRARRSVVGALEQAKRYARGVTFAPASPGGTGAQPASEAAREGWGKTLPYKVPFLYATNGRPFLKQVIEESGIWFQDARVPTNMPRALVDWHSPEGLTKLLQQDAEEAHAKLKVDPISSLGLRYYQEAAIEAVEAAIEAGKRSALLAMATGTGKTRTCIGLVYRLLKTNRFNRVLFVVDRSALGEQAEGAFREVKVDSLKTFAEIFDLQGLESDGIETATRLHIATIQSMVRRVLYSDEPPPVDTYDCIVIDESHRGYTLDAELSDTEKELTEGGFRDEEDYVSKYTRVLDYFDAVKVGLTATPALHTRDIFGDPVYAYRYKEAVVDGFLVDHEPPVRIVTALARDGIGWQAGEEVATYTPLTKSEQLWLLPDEVKIEVDGFNRKVLTENFNRAVCQELVNHIDPDGPEKTLVFCANDRHCDLFVRVLGEVFAETVGPVHENAILKITGAADKPRELLRRFKNEQRPAIAVTVDLLATGIDVRAISNLVFLRRVRSRILYDQMLGRATRLCPEIGKEVFRVFDAVDLYASLKDVTDMKPVATVRKVSFEQLTRELSALTGDDADAGETGNAADAGEAGNARNAGTTGSKDARDHVRDELLAKLNRKKKRIQETAAEEFEHLAGSTIDEFLEKLREGSAADVADAFNAKAGLAALLDRKVPSGDAVYVSHHEDEVVEVSRGYGTDADGNARTRPEDYLDAFAEYVRTHINEIPALLLITTRPRDLTRKQLKDLKLALDAAGFGEPSLRTAWRQKSNVDIAASIIGYIRQAALGDALVPYDTRVDRALTAILSRQSWNVHQRKWLTRIAEQMKANTVVDHAALSQGRFAEFGGHKRLNKLFDGRIDALVSELAEQVWKVGA